MSLFRSKTVAPTPTISPEEAGRILQAQKADFSRKIDEISEINESADWQTIMEALTKREMMDEYERKVHFHAEKAIVMGIFAIGAIMSVVLRSNQTGLDGIYWLAWLLFIGSFALIPEWVAYHLWIRKAHFLGKQRAMGNLLLAVCMVFSIMGIMSLLGMVRHDTAFADFYYTYINPACLALIFIKDFVIHGLSPQSKMKRHLEKMIAQSQQIEIKHDAAVLAELERIHTHTTGDYIAQRRDDLQRIEQAPTEYEMRRKELAQLYGETAIEPLSDRDLMMYQKALNDQGIAERMRKLREDKLNAESYVNEMVTQSGTIKRAVNEASEENAYLHKELREAQEEIRRLRLNVHPHPESVHLQTVQSDGANVQGVHLSANVQPESVQTENVQNEKMYTKQCEWCGNGFETKRTDARFCKAVCRTRANEAKKAALQAENTLFDELAIG